MNRLFLWKLAIPAVTLTLLAAACSPVSPPDASATAALASPTLAPSQTPRPTLTPLPPSPTATFTPLSGTATVQVNVRSGPGTDYEVLGMIQPDTVLALTGKNETAAWLQIEYAAGADGKGWVTAACFGDASEQRAPLSMTRKRTLRKACSVEQVPVGQQITILSWSVRHIPAVDETSAHVHEPGFAAPPGGEECVPIVGFGWVIDRYWFRDSLVDTC